MGIVQGIFIGVTVLMAVAGILNVLFGKGVRGGFGGSDGSRGFD